MQMSNASEERVADPYSTRGWSTVRHDEPQPRHLRTDVRRLGEQAHGHGA